MVNNKHMHPWFEPEKKTLNYFYDFCLFFHLQCCYCTQWCFWKDPIYILNIKNDILQHYVYVHLIQLSLYRIYIVHVISMKIKKEYTHYTIRRSAQLVTWSKEEIFDSVSVDIRLYADTKSFKVRARSIFLA